DHCGSLGVPPQGLLQPDTLRRKSFGFSFGSTGFLGFLGKTGVGVTFTLFCTAVSAKDTGQHGYPNATVKATTASKRNISALPSWPGGGLARRAFPCPRPTSWLPASAHRPHDVRADHKYPSGR